MEIDQFELSINNHVEDYLVDGSPFAWSLTATRSETTVYLTLKTLDYDEFQGITEGNNITIEYAGHQYEIFPTSLHHAEMTEKRIYILEITGIVKGFDMPKLVP